jgi:dTDP-4-amino-4,6-dideoxy-D-glucose transaminase
MLSSPKHSMLDLALFGGRPSFEPPVILGEPVVPDVDAVLREMSELLQSRRFTNDGPRVHAFEHAIMELTGASHCVATDNGTSGLQIAARALGVEGEVIVPAFTFIATAHAFAWQGLCPVFVDVDPHTHTIDPNAVAAAVTPRTTAICGVHLWGNVCDVAALTAIAERHDLTLLFDAAHALGCADSDGVRVGGFGNAEIFSFHATKFVSAFEGGAVVTDDARLAERLARARNFGFDDSGHAAGIGINAKMSEASAVMGLHSLQHYDQIVAVNRRNLRGYSAALEGCAGIDILLPDDLSASNCQYVVARIDEARSGLSRDTLLAALRAEGVFAKAYFVPPCHLAEPYRTPKPGHLPVSELLAREVLCLPSGLAVELEQVFEICELIRSIRQLGPRVERRLHGRHHASNVG